MSDINRRYFIQALALAVLAVGAPLPIGLPTEARQPWYWYALLNEGGSVCGYATANHPYHLEPIAAPTKRLTRLEYDKLVERSKS